MRLLALPMLALTAAVIVLPARSIAGPEALAYVYLALFTLAPLSWFGLHRLAGALQSPRFTRAECFALAFSGLAILIVPPLLLGMAQGPIYTLSHRLQESGFDHAAQAPLPLTALPVQRFRLGAAGGIPDRCVAADESRVTAFMLDAQDKTIQALMRPACP